jgi:hypothetical protein
MEGKYAAQKVYQNGRISSFGPQLRLANVSNPGDFGGLRIMGFNRDGLNSAPLPLVRSVIRKGKEALASLLQ